jgi:AraC-like DNA-binding protein
MPIIFPGTWGAILLLKWYRLEVLGASLAISLLGTLLYLLVSPRVLFGYIFPYGNQNKQGLGLGPDFDAGRSYSENKSRQDPGESQKDAASGYKKARSFDLPDPQPMIDTIDTLFERQKPFKQPGYSIHDLSRDLSIPVYQLSFLLNQKYASNFSNWINGFRVEYFLELSAGEKSKDFTLEALSREAGFSNRVTFINAFRKVKGTTPGVYLKILKS